jgi:hypothetical protein
MRERWTDRGDGSLVIQTETLTCYLFSKARKNYHHIQSNWSLNFYIKGKYGYMARIYCTFVDTMEGAMNRAETMMHEMFESIQEII